MWLRVRRRIKRRPMPLMSREGGLMHTFLTIVAVWAVIDLMIVAVMATAKPISQRKERKWWK